MPINYSDYPDNWLTEIRPRILERDGHKCKFCGVPNYAIIYRPPEGGYIIGYQPSQDELDELGVRAIERRERAYWEKLVETKVIAVILTIAHLDHNIKNNLDENLAALCQKCHFNTDRGNNIFRAKYGKKAGLQPKLFTNEKKDDQ